MILHELVLTTLGGFFCHQFRRITERVFDRGWLDLVHYGMGVTAVLPFALRIRRRLPVSALRFTISYVLAFTGFGVGVVIGWFVDTVFDRRQPDGE